MTDKQEKKMIKAANKHWSDESGGYDKKDIMVDAFVEGYKQAFALYSVSQRSKLLKVEDKDVPFDDYVKRFFKVPKMELIYRGKRNNSMMTESQLIKYYKRAMCL